MNTKNKAIAGILIAVLIGSVAVVVASNGGLVGPKDIMPGAITSTHIANGAITDDKTDGALTNASLIAGAIWSADINVNAGINSSQIKNGTIDDEDLGDAAIPNITAVSTGITEINTTHNVTGNRWDVFNESIGTTERASKFLITYSARVINISGVTGDKVVVKCNVLRHYNNDQSLPLNLTYPAVPTGGVYFASFDWVNITNTVQFFNASVPSGNDMYVNISATTTNATANLTDQILTVIAIPTG